MGPIVAPAGLPHQRGGESGEEEVAEDDEGERQAAREAWPGTDRPDLIKQIDEEFPEG